MRRVVAKRLGKKPRVPLHVTERISPRSKSKPYPYARPGSKAKKS
jgi:hypothetical protein